MKNLAFLFLFLLIFINSKAQIKKAILDSQVIQKVIKFPLTHEPLVISFSSKMIDLSEIPDPLENKKSIEELLTIYNNGYQEDIGIMIQLYNAYYENNEPNIGYSYLQKAYNLAIELYDMNPSNIELVEQITEMMVIVGRLQDVPTMWKGYCERNPNVARSWAKLAFYEVQMLRLEDAQLHLQKAYALNPNVPDIYVSALMYSTFQYLIQYQQNKRAGTLDHKTLKIDFSFLQTVAKEHPELELAQMSVQLAKLIAIFYEVLFANTEQFRLDHPFKLQLNKQQQLSIQQIEYYMQSCMKNQMVINKFIPLKALVILEVLKSNPDKAATYLLEAKRYITADIDLHKIMSYSYLHTKNYNKAIAHLEKASRHSPTFDDMFALARLYFDSFKYKEAIKTLQLLMQSHPERFEIIYGILSIYLRQGKYEEARATLARMEMLYEDVDLEADEYYPFYKAICMITNAEQTNETEVRRLLQLVVDRRAPCYKEAVLLVNKFL